ncbi:MAG: hypothetical protein K0S67_886 [Nitrososphaeraceae archaeon]|nr:hypothetical protein [Nitrososphaeraceae archaeon]
MTIMMKQLHHQQLFKNQHQWIGYRGSYRIRTRTPIYEPIIDDASPEHILGGTCFDTEDERVIDDDNEVDYDLPEV